MFDRLATCLTGALAALTLLISPLALAQAQPASGGLPCASRPMRIIAPFASGGLADVLARAVAQKLAALNGQAVIVENRAGAGGNLGADLVAHAEPDGCTVLMSSTGILTINHLLYAQMPFDAASAFAPVSLVADMPMLLVVAASSPARNAGEFVALARRLPEGIFFGSPGNGTTSHLGLELFQSATGTRVVHVPFKSAGEVVTGILSGQVQGTFDNPPTVMGQIRSGALRALGVAAPARVALMPELPTLSESGLPGFEVSSWFGVVAPARTPTAVINRLSADIARSLRDEDIQRRFAELGARLVGNTPEAFGTYIAAERRKWEQVIRAAGIKPS
jgi:tripartite-type tricarboxylate transporter receptor subunit TctC